MWLPHFVQRNALVRPLAIALSDAARQLTWSELDARTDSIACALTDLGIASGDRVLVMSSNRVEVIELYVAISKAGGIACPLNPNSALPEVEHHIANVEPIGAFAERTVLERLGLEDRVSRWAIAIGEESYEALTRGPRQGCRLPHQGDAALIFSTSATTGRSKAVVVSHRSLMACYVGMAAETAMSPSDIMLNPCPLFHGSVVIGLALLAAGGQLAIQRDFTPQRFLTDVARLRATRAFVVPSMIRFVLAAKAFDATDLSSLREIMHGGGPMTEDLLQAALQRFSCRFLSVYGVTEGGGPIALRGSDEPRPPGVAHVSNPPLPAGRMIPGAQIVVVDDEGDCVPPGEVGEICVRGDGVMERYWRNEEATEKTLAGGWLHTGDIGYMDAAGYLFLLDRKHDLVIRGGQNVYPAEIESVLRKQAGVADAAAVGVPSDEWGEVPVAFVVSADGAPLDLLALIASCSAELASYKRPAALYVIDEIPRNAAGKILRRVLRERLGARTELRPSRGAVAS
jgi:acyl-CoA synthetase (AMP-forming)/AMP-acid ligase II